MNIKKCIIILTVLLFGTGVTNSVFAKKKQKTEQQNQKTEIKKKKQKNEQQNQKIEIKKKKQKNEQQNLKAEIKNWKHQKNAMQPLQLKDLVEENHRLKTSNHKLTEEIKITKEQLEELIKFRIQQEQEEAQKNRHGKQGPGSAGNGYRGEGSEETGSQEGDDYYYLAQGMIGPDGFSKNDWAIDKNGQFYIKGLVFKVQIGAYRKRDLSNVLEGEKPQEVFEQEQSKGVNMYTIRHFRNYWKANEFKKELRAMGLKDAYIVPFKDGKRVPLKDVLPEITKKKKQA